MNDTEPLLIWNAVTKLLNTMTQATILVQDTAELAKIPDRHIHETETVNDGEKVTLQDILGAQQTRFEVTIQFPEDKTDEVTLTSTDLIGFFEYDP